MRKTFPFIFFKDFYLIQCTIIIIILPFSVYMSLIPISLYEKRWSAHTFTDIVCCKLRDLLVYAFSWFLDLYQLLFTMYKEGGWPFRLLNSIRLRRPAHLQCMLFVAAWPHVSAKSRSIWYNNKRTAWVRGKHLLEERRRKSPNERQAARCHQCREIGVKRMKTYKWKSIWEGRKA